jgi:hypothetical protein
MTKQQDHDELDRSAVGLAEASISPADGELPLEPSDATVLTANAEPNADEVDVRMAKIEEILGYTTMPKLETYELVGEWVRHAEVKVSVFGQPVHKPKGGRPEGGVSRAARELPVPGKTFGARRKFIERAIKIDSMSPEAKHAVRASRLDNVQSALLDIAEEHSQDAQIAKVQEIAARKAMPRRRKKSTTAGNESALTLNQVEHLKAELAAANERKRVLEEQLETARGMASRTPAVDGPVKADTTDERSLSPDDQAALDAVMVAWAKSTELRAALVVASSVVREPFLAALREDIASASSVAK